MIDKYTQFNRLTQDDFIYILHYLHNADAITINDDDYCFAQLINVLEEYELENIETL